MYILAIETTGPHASAALINEEGRLVETISQGNMNHLKQLVPMIDTLLCANDIEKTEIAAVAASCGPGSFTGIRIGVSTARAIAQALEIPCIAVPTLKAFVYNAPEYDGIIAPVFDARRNQVYAGAYMWNEKAKSAAAEIREIVKGGAYMLNEFLDALSKTDCGKLCFFGDGVPAFREELEKFAENCGKSVEFCEDDMAYQRASSVASLALKLSDEGKKLEYGQLLPDYMRKSEAERKLEDGTLGKKNRK